MNFQQLIKTEQLKHKDLSCFQEVVSIMLINVLKNVNNCRNFNIYEHDKIHALLSWTWNKFFNLEARAPNNSV